jgi:PAP2 superfamily C-terminal
MSASATPHPASASTRRPSLRSIALRVVLTAAALGIWFWTQSLIGARPLPAGGIGDGLLAWTAPINSYLTVHIGACNALLIVSSGIIDLLAIFLIASWIFGSTVRPFLGLVILLGLRQLMQAIVALPAPPNTLWHYPGFPSLLVTYGVGNDFFFSGHTAMAVLGATELIRIGKRWLSAIAVTIIVFEVTTVLVLRAHYTMDVFTGLIAALLVASFIDRFSVPIDRALARAKS